MHFWDQMSIQIKKPIYPKPALLTDLFLIIFFHNIRREIPLTKGGGINVLDRSTRSQILCSSFGREKEEREREKKPTKTGVVMVPIKHLKCTVECTTKQPNTIFSYIKYVRSLAKMSKSDGFQDKSK